MGFYIVLLLSLFVPLTGLLYYYWKAIPEFFPRTSPTAFSTKLTVIIAVRNEAESIGALLDDLNKQSYPTSFFEVIVVNDHSTDETASLVLAQVPLVGYSLSLLSLDDGRSGKKAAIGYALSKARGTLVVTTDGDCRVKPSWLSMIESFYRETNVKMVIGGVTFLEEPSLRSKILTLEFASLVGSGASMLASGFPSMCNGANLAYEKEVFFEVGGYSEKNKMASGDDEFLMHAIHEKYPGKVAFLKNKEATVETLAPVSWKAFFHQRKRWASKWENYTYTHIQLIALLVFALNFTWVISIFAMPFSSYPPMVFLSLVFFKISMEFLFLRSILVYFGRNLNIGVFLLTELLYPFYVVFFALAGRIGKYQWKGRIVK